ncbi:MAG TPA: flagellar hook-associated protein 3 [Gammaproteobacteria bacterium]|nr:flagellar hook-associated protein 3 [Gammaproteobacteria bacterium]
MRISTPQFQIESLSRILDQQVRLSEVQQQISTGKRIETPSDDPSGAARIVGINQFISINAQYKRNADTAQARIGAEDVTLSSFLNVYQKIRELTVQGLNATNGRSDRASLASEIRKNLDQLVSLAETKDSSGKYIFSGFSVNQNPVGDNGAGTYTYQGDQGKRQILIGPNRTISDSDTGFDVFFKINNTLENAFSTVYNIAAELQANTISPPTNTIVFNNANAAPGAYTLDVTTDAVDGEASTLTVGGYTLTFSAGANSNSNINTVGNQNDNVKAALDLAVANGDINTNDVVIAQPGGAGTAVTVTSRAATSTQTHIASSFNANGGALVATNVNSTTGTGAAVNDTVSMGGITYQFLLASGTPTGTNIGVAMGATNAATATTFYSQVNAQFTAGNTTVQGTANDSAGTLTFISRAGISNLTITEPVSTGTANAVIAGTAIISRRLNDIDAVMESVLEARSSVGARLNAIDVQNNINEDVVLQGKKLLSEIEDLDLAEAITQLNLRRTSLEAAQQSYVLVQGLSLFNFL